MSDAGTRRVKLLYFAWVREKVGSSSEELELPPGVETVSDVIGWLRARGPEFDEAVNEIESGGDLGDDGDSDGE